MRATGAARRCRSGHRTGEGSGERTDDKSTADDEKVSTPVGDEPRWDGAVSRGVPGRNRRLHSGEQPGAEPVTVEQLLARQGSSVGRRRAARRVEQPAPLEDPPPAVRNGLPPVPGALSGREAAVSPQAGLPPVPSAPSRSAPVPVPVPVPEPLPGPAAAPASWAPEPRPSRRSGPIPPLPGLAPVAGAPAPGALRRRRTPVDRPPMSSGRRGLLRAALAVATLLGVVVLYHLGLYFYVDRTSDRVDALATNGPEIIAPQLQADAQTYLVVGTGVPDQKGPASVATLLATVSPRGDRAVLVSVPPTALVDTPMCRTTEGSLRDPTTETFAGALLDGGPACLVRAVQQLSGLRVDHYLGVDLVGLPGMVDALGGVPFCVVPSPAISAAAVPPQAGASQLTGAAATGFLRPADPQADVSGAAVAERAQRLLISTLRTATARDTVLNTPKLTRFLTRAAGSLTVDQQTTLGDLRSLAGSLGDLSGDAVERVGLPIAATGYVPTGSKQPYVLVDGEATRTLFDTVIRKTRVPSELLPEPQGAAGDAPASEDSDAAEPAAGAEPTAPAAGALTVPPAQVTVDVLNATGTSGLAATAADALKADGFTIGDVGNDPGRVSTSVVRHGPDALEQARTVAAAVPGSVLQASDALAGKVQVVLGPGYTTVVPVQLPAAGTAAPDTRAAGPTTPPPPVTASCG